MKTTRLAIALAILTTGAGFALAQNQDAIRERVPVPPPPPDAAVEVLAEHELQMAATRDQMREVERAMAASQKAVQLAQSKAGDARTYARTMARGGVRNGSVGRALVIPKDPTDLKSLGEVEEDMNVMAHILDKAANEDRKSGRAMGIPVFVKFAWGGSPPQNLFIEGSGALFFLNVNYPLQPAPDKDVNAEAKDKPISEWDEAKKEMARPAGGEDNLFAFGEGFERNFVWDANGTSPYDTEKVEDLKADLTAALKNVANIRKLKSDETVTVVVTGANALPGGKPIKAVVGKPAPGKEQDLVVAELAELKAGDRAPAAAPAKLVLRVKKSDAEAFQNGKLNLDDFKKKLTVMVY